MRKKEEIIMMIEDKREAWGDDGSYTVYYHCPIGKQEYVAEYDCTPGFGDVYEWFCNEKCRQNCIVEENGLLERQIKQIHECPFIQNKEVKDAKET